MEGFDLRVFEFVLDGKRFDLRVLSLFWMEGFDWWDNESCFDGEGLI